MKIMCMLHRYLYYMIERARYLGVITPFDRKNEQNLKWLLREFLLMLKMSLS